MDSEKMFYRGYWYKREFMPVIDLFYWEAFPEHHEGEIYAGKETRGLPAIHSGKSEKRMIDIIDAIMDLPPQGRNKTVDQWNYYIEEKGLFDDQEYTGANQQGAIREAGRSGMCDSRPAGVDPCDIKTSNIAQKD